MKTHIGIIDRMASMAIGLALFIMASVLVALGVTLLPVIGILLALPVLALALIWFEPETWAVAEESENEAPSGISHPLRA
jgi:hypothetical protein